MTIHSLHGHGNCPDRYNCHNHSPVVIQMLAAALAPDARSVRKTLQTLASCPLTAIGAKGNIMPFVIPHCGAFKVFCPKHPFRRTVKTGQTEIIVIRILAVGSTGCYQ